MIGAAFAVFQHNKKCSSRDKKRFEALLYPVLREIAKVFLSSRTNERCVRAYGYVTADCVSAFRPRIFVVAFGLVRAGEEEEALEQEGSKLPSSVVLQNFGGAVYLMLTLAFGQITPGYTPPGTHIRYTGEASVQYRCEILYIDT